MTQANQAASLSDAEIERLESLLSSELFRGDAMPLDAMQGLFFAIASGPEEVPSSRWLPAVLGETPANDAAGEKAEALDLLLRFKDQCARELVAGNFGLHLYTLDDGARDFQTWCAGYLDGVDLAAPEWDEAGDPDELDELLFPFIVLADELPDEDKAQFKASEWVDLVQSCESAIGEAITDVREYWKVVLHPPVTMRRESPKVGRNDPCPCGSGKKFKHCCAAPEGGAEE